jgi:uncharacterized protein
MMLLDISQALKSPGMSYGFTLADGFDPICAGGEEITFLKPVEVAGNFVFTGEIFFLQGNIKAEYSALCCRCLKEIQSSMSISFSEEFARVEDENHPDRYLYRGEQLELTQMVIELISLNTPMRHLCSEDCRGLCPVCGADRNNTDCHCPATSPDDETM